MIDCLTPALQIFDDYCRPIARNILITMMIKMMTDSPAMIRRAAVCWFYFGHTRLPPMGSRDSLLDPRCLDQNRRARVAKAKLRKVTDIVMEQASSRFEILHCLYISFFSSASFYLIQMDSDASPTLHLLIKYISCLTNLRPSIFRYIVWKYFTSNVLTPSCWI